MFICPVCGDSLTSNNRTYMCRNGHSFDIARQGYVNLLCSQQSSLKRHGDDRVMVSARKEFLEKGYYNPLIEKLCKITLPFVQKTVSILDAGCGEGWYCGKICQYLKSADVKVNFTGIDISKDALKYAGRRCGNDVSLAVASVYNMPIGNNTQDLVFNIFSPLAENEYSRILKNGGILIRVAPLEKHLFGLKEKIYEKPYLNDKIQPHLSGFNLLKEEKVCYTLSLDNSKDIQNLFKMTPYYYKTGVEDQNKIETLEKLDTEIAFNILVYRKLP